MDLLDLQGIPASSFKVNTHVLPLTLSEHLSRTPGAASLGGCQLIGLEEALRQHRMSN